MRYFDIKRLMQFQHHGSLDILKLFNGFSPCLFAVIFHLTYKCNLSCHMCVLTKKRASHSLPDEMLDWKILENILDEISNFRIRPIVHFSGGEPLIYKDFVKLCHYCGQKKLNWAITTNGFYLSDFAEEIVKRGCRCINVSIDGTEEIHDLVRGHAGSYKRAISGIKKSAELKLGLKKRYPLVVATCTINDKNYSNLKTIADMFGALPVDSFSFQHLSFGRDFIFGDDFNYELAQKIDIETLTKNLSEISNAAYNKPVFFVPYLKIKNLESYYKDLEYDFGFSCINPWLMAEVKPTGKVIICHEEVGDITENPLKSIWNNPESRRIRRLIKNGNLTKRCLRCCHRRYR